MNKEILKHCMQGIIQYLDGNIEQFMIYRENALKIYYDENYFPVKERIPGETQEQLYELVS